MRVQAWLLALLLPALPLPLAGAASEDDCGSGQDAPYDPAVGLILSAPVDCMATFAASDERDAYRFEVPPGRSFEVRVEPTDPTLQAGVVVYTPDHGPGMPPTFHAARVASVTGVSYEPGYWQVFLWVCDAPACSRFRDAEYRIRVILSGDAHATQDEAGAVSVGLPAGGSRVNRLLGPSEHDGLDGDWVDLAKPAATRTSFLRLSWAGCANCLEPEFALTDGRVVKGACGRLPDAHDCRVPLGAVRVLVSGKAGLDVAYDLRHWYPA